MLWGGGWMAIQVVVCGKIVVKCVVKFKNCRIGTKIGVVVDMDLMIMIVVKDKKTKRQKGKKAKMQKGKKTKRHKYY